MYQKYITSQKFVLLLGLLFGGMGVVFARIPLTESTLTWSPIFMILLALPAFIGLYFWQGWKQASIILAILSLFGFIIESVGVATGFPYGAFYYNEALGYRLFGLVPWTLPFGWVPLVIGAAYLTRSIQSIWKRIIAGTTLLLTADLVLDPGATAMHFWTWVHGGVYYGVPVSNFLGWILSGSIGMVLFWIFYTETKKRTQVVSVLCFTSLFLSTVFWSGVAWSIKYYIPAVIGVVFVCVLLYVFTEILPEKEY